MLYSENNPLQRSAFFNHLNMANKLDTEVKKKALKSLTLGDVYSNSLVFQLFTLALLEVLWRQGGKVRGKNAWFWWLMVTCFQQRCLLAASSVVVLDHLRTNRWIIYLANNSNLPQRLEAALLHPFHEDNGGVQSDPNWGIANDFLALQLHHYPPLLKR